MSIRHFMERPIFIKDILGMITDESYENIIVKDYAHENVIFDSNEYEKSFMRGNMSAKDITEFEDCIILKFDIDNEKNLNLYVTDRADLNSYYIGVKTWIKENGEIKPTIRYVEEINGNNTCKFGRVPMQLDSVDVAYEIYRALIENSVNAFLIVTDNSVFCNEVESNRHDYFILEN